MVAKTGEVSSCAYNDKCRYSHDLDAFKAQVEDTSCRQTDNERILIVMFVIWIAYGLNVYVMNAETC